MNDYIKKELVDFFRSHVSKIVLIPEGLNNLYDVFQLGLTPKVIHTEYEIDNVYDGINTTGTVNNALQLVEDKHKAIWTYFHHDVLRLMNVLNLEEYFDNEVHPEYIYAILLENIGDIFSERTNLFSLYDRKYQNSTEMFENNNVEDILIADLTGNLKISEYTIPEIFNIIDKNEKDINKIKHYLLLNKKLENF